jgi:hypothetical protein
MIVFLGPALSTTTTEGTLAWIIPCLSAARRLGVLSRHFGKVAQCLLLPKADIRCDGFDSGCFLFFSFTPIDSPRSPLGQLT